MDRNGLLKVAIQRRLKPRRFRLMFGVKLGEVDVVVPAGGLRCLPSVLLSQHLFGHQ